MVLAEVLKTHASVKEVQRFGVDDWGVRLKNGLLVFVKKDKKGLIQVLAHNASDKRLRPRHIPLKDLKTKARLCRALKELAEL